MTMADMYIVVSSAGRRTSMGPLSGGGDGTADPAAVGEKARLRRPVIFCTGVSRCGVVFHGAGGIVSSLWQKK